ncbi:MAG: DUF3305 domain-containing protein [Gammaproteobacteria bacterium]|nr:DUF3305 domain-containing protein [Gammaproteobacteria bacterium]
MTQSHSTPAETDLPSEFPVSVIMERGEIQRGPWRFPRWRVVGVVAGEAFEDQQRARVHSDGEGERLLWTGFTLRLDRSASETYWFNLTSETPLLFVLCRPDAEGGLEPHAVTVDHDLATAYTEAEETVLTAPIPPEIREWMERFVVTHYRPQERKQRKRRDWSEEAAEHGRGRSRHRP